MLAATTGLESFTAELACASRGRIIVTQVDRVSGCRRCSRSPAAWTSGPKATCQSSSSGSKNASDFYMYIRTLQAQAPTAKSSPPTRAHLV